MQEFWKIWKIPIIIVGGTLMTLFALYWAGIGTDFISTYRDNRALKQMHLEQVEKTKQAELKAEAAEKLFTKYQGEKGDANALKPLLEQINTQLADIKADQESLRKALDIQDQKRQTDRQQYLDDLNRLSGKP